MELRDAHLDLRDRLTQAGRLLPTGVDGLFGRDHMFEYVVGGLRGAISMLARNDDPTRVDYPPLVPTSDLDHIGYLHSFPQLCGVVYSFVGDDRAHRDLIERLDTRGDIGPALTRAELTLTPACCYPVYPSCAGDLPADGRTFELESYCFRHEPSVDPMRLQSFRQFENVRLGTPEHIVDWRRQWLERAIHLFEDLELDAVLDNATDPFFGRAGRLMAVSQREQELKVEVLVNVYGDDHRTACASLNNHQNHFSELFNIKVEGDLAHTACIGFGLERCAVALFATHGTSTADWPAPVVMRLFGNAGA